MNLNEEIVFQIDNNIVKESYSQSNYKIEYDYNNNSDYCAIYFSSNNIYYPNNETTFIKYILMKNRFEWTNQKVGFAHKHIFIRDIHKQWYLTGINSEINNPEKLFTFLKDETTDYKIITIGSSAGGYAALLFGAMLKAWRIFAFSPQFEIYSLLNTSNELVDPIIFRNKNNTEVSRFYDVVPFISNGENIFYFCPIRSNWDNEQLTHAKVIPNINIIRFNTRHHGVPFHKNCLKYIWNMDEQKLKMIANESHYYILFSLRVLGLKKFIISFSQLVYYQFKKAIYK